MAAIKLGIVALLILLNGFFVATEFAIVKVRSTRIRVLADRGSWRARLAEKVVANLDAMLSATQLGITLVTIGLGWAGEQWVTEIVFVPLMEWLRVERISPDVLHSVAFVCSYIVISALHIVIGELAPKSLAIQRAEGTALWVSVPIQFFYLIFYPAIWLLNGTANLALRAVGIAPASEAELELSEEELRILLARSRRGGHLSEAKQRLMENVLGMTGKTARQAMVPRTSIVFLSTRRSLEENLEVARRSGHTRFPLCEGDLDQIIGMVHMKDLLWARESGQLSPDFHEVRRDVIFLPESARLDRVLNVFQQRHIHLAIVVDEYGATTGMITLEDVLEELVGEIQDEFDHELPPIRQIRPGEYRVDALCALDLFRRAFDLKPVGTKATTVGGLVFELCGHLPERGEVVPMGDDRFIVEAVRGQRIALVRFLTNKQARLPRLDGDQPDESAND